MKELKSYIRELTYILNKIDGQYYFCAKHLGLKENELAILYALDDGRQHTQKEIGELWLIPKTTVNTIVRQYVKEGYITLTCEKKSKEKIIELTEKGREYASLMLKNVYEAEECAMDLTLREYSNEFIKALECFSEHLSREFDLYIQKEGEKS